ncbi:MAG: hypothetical protein ACAH83_19065 [Alphaproteobacteria bacterium]
MTPETCITLSNAGFVLNFAGVVVTAFSLDEPPGDAAGGAMQKLLSYVRRPRVFAAGIFLIGFGIVTLVAGHYSDGGCLTLRGLMPSPGIPDIGARPVCSALRPVAEEISGMSLQGSLLSFTVLLIMVTFLVAFIRGAGWMGRMNGTIRILIGGLLAPPLFVVTMLLGTNLYWTALPQRVLALQGANFRLENYESDAGTLRAALNAAIPKGSSQTYVESVLAGTTRTVTGQTAVYTHRTRSLMACAFSPQPPPLAWQIEASYTPEGALRAMLVRPVTK